MDRRRRVGGSDAGVDSPAKKNSQTFRSSPAAAGRERLNIVRRLHLPQKELWLDLGESMRNWRIIRWLAGFGGLSVILLFTAAFLLPRILDSQAVRDRIRAFLLARTNGNVSFENIDLKWLPRPTVVVRRASFSFDDKVNGKIESIQVHPSIRGLLTGQWDISRVEMASLALSVRLSEPGQEPFNIDEIEGQIRSLLASMAAQIPGMILSVRGGSAEIKIGDRPPVVITGLDGRLVAPPGELDL